MPLQRPSSQPKKQTNSPATMAKLNPQMAHHRVMAALFVQDKSNHKITETIVELVKTTEPYVMRILNKLDLDPRLWITM